MADKSSSDRKELKSGWKNEVEVKTVAADDVSKHNSKQDLWMTIHGKVYNVTEYARDHPGGLDILLEVGGTDATSAFEDVGHSEDAREILHSYLVGVLEGASQETSAAGAVEIPDTQVVRRGESNTSHGLGLTLKQKCELVLLAGAATTVIWTFNHFPLLRWPHTSLAQGLVLAGLTTGTIFLGGIRYFDHLNSTPSFDSFPSHIRSTVRRRGEFHPAGVLAPQNYQKFKLRRKEELSEGLWRFTFDLPTRWSVLGLPIGQHVAIKGVIDGHTVVRSYTPVSNNRDLGRLELLIRVYPKGQLGNYLKNLQIGDAADIRGPKGEMKYVKNTIKEVGMVAGGTGITPMFQIIRALCEDPTDQTKITLVYANRSESDILLKDRLDHFADVAGDKFKVHYVLDNPPEGWTGGQGHVTAETLRQHMPKAGKGVKAMLCGPPGMVNAMKAGLVDLGYEEPGAVSKMSDQIFCF